MIEKLEAMKSKKQSESDMSDIGDNDEDDEEIRPKFPGLDDQVKTITIIIISKYI